MTGMTATESDVEFARWLGMRWPHKMRPGMFVPPAELRKRAYDEETDQMLAFLRAERITSERAAEAAQNGAAA